MPLDLEEYPAILLDLDGSVYHEEHPLPGAVEPANVFATDERQRVALRILRAGRAMLVGVCDDRVYPSPRGMEFGSGALTRMLAYAANVRPIFCGKPEPVFFDELCHRLGVTP